LGVSLSAMVGGATQVRGAGKERSGLRRGCDE
jgi:hypothetical protein